MEKTVLMISPNDFPNGDAGAVRDLAFAKIYSQLGYKPVVVCCNKKTEYGVYEGIEYYSYFLNAKTNLDKLFRYFKQKNMFLKKLNNIEKKFGTPGLIHLYGVSNNIIAYMKKYAHINNLQILHDSVEWYSPCEFKYGKYDKAYIINNRLNTKVIKSPIKVIAISSYLKTYFESKGIISERIPVILEVDSQAVNNKKDDIVKLIYAGNPANKDYLKEIIEGVLGLSEAEKERVRLNIYGITEKQLYDLKIGYNFEKNIIPHGRVPRTEVESALKDSDFSLLLRPGNERYTKAGFPTKTVEAMSNGVAMMCNLTSDLGLYLKDGENSIIVEQCTKEAMTKAIRRAISLSSQEIDILKRNAKKTASDYFDYRMWISTVQRLIER